MSNHSLKNGREPAIVYQTIDGWTYRVLDLYDQSRFGDLYLNAEKAKHAAEADGYYVVGGRWEEQS